MKTTQFQPQLKASSSPDSAILNLLPGSWKPYAELIRLQKPTGVAMFYFPALFGSLLAAVLRKPVVLPWELFSTNAVLFLDAFLARGLLCTWNDIVDQDLDVQVARTRSRPLPRGAVTTLQALIFTLGQIFMCIWAFSLLQGRWFWCGWPFMALHVVYPYTKRVTHYPQLVLGLANAGGSAIALAALGVDISLNSPSRSTIALGLLAVAVTAWATIFDTVYSAQDLEDDKKAGIKSTMVAHERSARVVLRIAASLELLALALIGFVIRSVSPLAGNTMIALTCACTAMALGMMVEKVDFKSTASCGWWFSTGNLLVGAAIAAPLGGAYIVESLR